MDARTTRTIQVGLGSLLVAVMVWAFVYDGGGSGSTLPEAVDSISPGDGAQAPRQQPVTVDMAVGYDVILFVEDRASGEFVEVDASTTRFEAATGVLVWTPPIDAAPTGRLRLRIEYRATTGLPETGSYEWSIRTY